MAHDAAERPNAAMFQLLDLMERRSASKSLYSLFQGLSASLLLSLVIRSVESNLSRPFTVKENAIVIAAVLLLMFGALIYFRQHAKHMDEQMAAMKAHYAVKTVSY
jgi:sulfite exporter TauE/SafE